MKTIKLMLALVFSLVTLVACAKVENEVVNLVKSIDGSYSTVITGVDVDLTIKGEEVTGKAGIGFVSKDISGTVDLKKQKISIDVAGDFSLSGAYEIVNGGDLEVEVSGQTIVFEKN